MLNLQGKILILFITLSLVRNATTDKIKLLKNIPKKFHKSDLEYNKYEENIEQPKNFKVILE